jgi:protein TonB
MPSVRLSITLGALLTFSSAAMCQQDAQSLSPPQVRVSQGVSQGLLVSRVDPVYPEQAKQAGIQGTVVLSAIISADGSVKSLRLVSGHPALTSAAIDAVKQWKYRPYLLNGRPVDYETTVTVKFTLPGSRGTR